MLKVNDKIKYVKENPFIKFPIGTIMTITDIKGTAIAVQGDYQTDGEILAFIGVMSYDEYEKYFEQVSSEWSEWKEYETGDGFCNYRECYECPIQAYCSLFHKITYRQRNNEIEVKAKLNKCHLFPEGKTIKGYANCLSTDAFNLKSGIDIALNKIAIKLSNQKIKYHNELISKY